jgi:acyl-CoA thioesterase
VPRRIPLHERLGIEPRFVGGGQSRVELTVAPHHLRTRGITHGGVFAALLDAAQGMAASSVAPAGSDVVTIQLNVNFIRIATLGERLTATAKVQHAGRRTAVTSAEVKTSSGQLSATGSATLLYIPFSDDAESTPQRAAPSTAST